MPPSNDLISIGIPTFNRPEGLRETLRRITSQSYPHLEILVSDNHSDDAIAVADVIAAFAHDKRIRFTRQNENIGSIRNFEYLLNQATGKYFLWAADDDELESTYVAELHKALTASPNSVIAMTGYDVVDTMAAPPIYTNLSKHLTGLQDPDTFTRLKKYILQPDHLGKSRLVWGMFPRQKMAQAFADCLAKRDPSYDSPIWADLPIEFRMLSYGDLAIAPEVLFHVHLLPTSLGKQGLSGQMKKLMKITDRCHNSYGQVIRDSALGPSQKEALLKILSRKIKKDKIQLFIYYGIIGKFPRLARLVKQIWYFFS